MATDVVDQQVTPDDIKHFDNDAIGLVAEYHLAGWRSHMTSKGHVFLKAPDGTETASVSRDSLRGRSGRNATAPLKRWRRRQEQERQEREEQAHKGPGSSFGISDAEQAQAQPEQDLPPRVAKAIRNHPDVTAFFKALGDVDMARERVYVSVDTSMDKPWRYWSVVDTAAKRLIAHGDGYTRPEAFRMLREEGKLPPAATEEELMKIADGSTTCPECGHQASTPSGLRLHVKAKHIGYTCPECGKNTGFSGRSLSTHRRDVHGITPTNQLVREERRRRANTCPDCAETFTTPQGLAAHRRTEHARDVTAQVLALVAQHGHITPDLVMAELNLSKSAAASRLGRMVERGRLVRVGRATYGLPDAGDITGTSPDVTPDGDSEIDTITAGDVTGTSPVTPAGDPAGIVAQMAAIVAPGLSAEVENLRRERDQLRHDNDLLGKQVEDLQARLDLMREALGA